MEPWCSAGGTLWAKWGLSFCPFIKLFGGHGFQQLSFTLRVTCELSTNKRRTMTPGNGEGEGKCRLPPLAGPAGPSDFSQALLSTMARDLASDIGVPGCGGRAF